MRRESVTLIRDEAWLSHAVIQRGEIVEREVIEIRSGEWRPELIAYLATEGDRLSAAGYRFQTEAVGAEHWMRFVFKKEILTEGG